jgi:hypothetical protein
MMRDSGILIIDSEREELTKKINSLLFKTSCCDLTADLIEELKSAKNMLIKFRMKLGAKRATESFEGDFGWTDVFNSLNQRIENIIEKGNSNPAK